MIDKIKSELQKMLEIKIRTRFNTDAQVVVEEPKKAGLGDISVPVFSVAKAIGKPLPETVKIVREILAASEEAGLFEEISSVGGFVNLTLSKPEFAKAVMSEFKKEGEMFGNSQVGGNKTICIDYSSPNIAKSFSIGHLRSTIIGHAIGNLMEKCSYNVVRINHLGDFGTQFGKVIYAYQHFGSEEAVRANPVEELAKLYVEFHDRAEKDPSMDIEARKIFKELEQGNPEYVKLWAWFREESLRDYLEVYDLLGVHFDSYNGEAFYNDKMAPVVDELEDKGLLQEDQGASVVFLGDDVPPALIKKSDGSTLYMTRDLAAVFYRKNTYKFDKVLYVVGNEQKLHFEQLRRLIRLMGYPFSEDIVHVNFGLVLQDGKKMSTRKGKIVKLADVINEAIQMSLEYIEEKNPDLENKAEIARKVGVSAIIFNDLKNYRANDFEFNLEEMVNFFGQTGPYLQYTSVRINSILSDAPNFKFNIEVDPEWYKQEPVFAIIKQLGQYQATIEKSVAEYAPSILAKYLLNLASLFNSLYGLEKFLVDNEKEKHTKLHLLKMVKDVLDDGMKLLGMQTIDKM
ncbi:MAG TPA: arginine--tRNA ligase [Bacillota bacterium]|nr:arginine--tRNA ligase [Bacillota bacterium]HPF43005.1 arginine--tRNA ligase [Bacillota bacterium]HPJ85489.1 arginine--tRNA ligase [Bacillota bacterium]HPQ62248.1 arginine--tRNA ligase [Bacillota bacterium]